MKMKGQIDSVYPAVEEPKKKKKQKKSAKKATKKKAQKKHDKEKAEAKINHTVKLPSEESTIIDAVSPTLSQVIPSALADTATDNEDVKQTVSTATVEGQKNDAHNGNIKAPIARASKNSQPLVATTKRQTMRRIIRQLSNAEITQGEALKTLRLQVLGLKQEDFASLVGVSRKTLSENENDKGNYTADIVNKLFQPFGLKVGLVACK